MPQFSPIGLFGEDKTRRTIDDGKAHLNSLFPEADSLPDPSSPQQSAWFMTRTQEPTSLDSAEPVVLEPLPERVSKRRWTKWLIGLLVVGGLAGGGYLTYQQMQANARQAARSQLQTVNADRVALPITISANGTIQAKQSTNVSPKNSGRLKTLLVEEGDRVQTGQVLAYMDNSNLQGQLLQAQGTLAAAQANLVKVETGNRPEDIAQAQSRLRSAEVGLSQAEADLQRYQSLFAAGGISSQALSQYRTTRDNARESVNQAQQALNLLRAGSRQEDVAQAQAQVLQAEGSLKTVQTQLEDTIIRAPFSGIVTKKYADPGDFVTPTTSSSDVSSASSSSILALASTYQAVANVAETDIRQIKVGQPVTIKADAYPDQTFQGKVAQIAPQATVEANVTSFQVKVDLTTPNQLLSSGMNVDMTFKAGTLNDVVVVPTVAIVRQLEGTGVMVLGNGGRPQFVPIETGVTIGRQTQVKSGLEGNEKVLVSVPQRRSQQGNNAPFAPGMPGGGMRRGAGGPP